MDQARFRRHFSWLSREKPVLIRHKMKRSPNGNCEIAKRPGNCHFSRNVLYSYHYKELEYANDGTYRSFPRPSLGDQRHRCGIPRFRRSSHFSIVTDPRSRLPLVPSPRLFSTDFFSFPYILR